MAPPTPEKLKEGPKPASTGAPGLDQGLQRLENKTQETAQDKAARLVKENAAQKKAVVDQWLQDVSKMTSPKGREVLKTLGVDGQEEHYVLWSLARAIDPEHARECLDEEGDPTLEKIHGYFHYGRIKLYGFFFESGQWQIIDTTGPDTREKRPTNFIDALAGELGTDLQRDDLMANPTQLAQVVKAIDDARLSFAVLKGNKDYETVENGDLLHGWQTKSLSIFKHIRKEEWTTLTPELVTDSVKLFVDDARFYTYRFQASEGKVYALKLPDAPKELPGMLVLDIGKDEMSQPSPDKKDESGNPVASSTRVPLWTNIWRAAMQNPVKDEKEIHTRLENLVSNLSSEELQKQRFAKLLQEKLDPNTWTDQEVLMVTAGLMSGELPNEQNGEVFLKDVDSLEGMLGNSIKEKLVNERHVFGLDESKAIIIGSLRANQLMKDIRTGIAAYKNGLLNDSSLEQRLRDGVKLKITIVDDVSKVEVHEGVDFSRALDTGKKAAEELKNAVDPEAALIEKTVVDQLFDGNSEEIEKAKKNPFSPEGWFLSLLGIGSGGGFIGKIFSKFMEGDSALSKFVKSLKANVHNFATEYLGLSDKIDKKDIKGFAEIQKSTEPLKKILVLEDMAQSRFLLTHNLEATSITFSEDATIEQLTQTIDGKQYSFQKGQNVNSHGGKIIVPAGFYFSSGAKIGAGSRFIPVTSPSNT